MDDIVPALLENIQSQFDEKTYNSAKLKKVLKRLSDKKATYIDVNDFAIEVGEILADVLGANITTEILPDGKMYFNIADRILNPTMQKNFDLVSGYAGDVQAELNQAAGIKLKAQSPMLNQDRIDGIINRVSSESDFEAIKWILQEPIVNFTQSVVDDAIKANVDFHAKAGLQSTITRTVRGKACDWCKNLAGTYPYHEEPENVYQRHDRCRCTVEYNPKDSRGIQNSHSKKWRDPQKDAKIEVRKVIGVPVSSGAKNYVRYKGDDRFYSAEQIRRLEYAYTQYDTIKNSNQSVEKRKIFSNIGQFKTMKDFSKLDVDIAFNHVFNDIHDLYEGKSLFTPDYDMAQSWNRLINGNQIEKHDLILLRHERLEHDYMYKENLDYSTAHRKTSAYFNYADALRKYKEGK